MCGKRLKVFSLLLVLSLLSLPVRFSSYSYADVILTDSEAEELMSEIQESKKDLTELKNQLNEAETQLNDVKNDCEEQRKRSTEAKIFAGSASASTLLITVVLLIVLL